MATLPRARSVLLTSKVGPYYFYMADGVVKLYPPQALRRTETVLWMELRGSWLKITGKYIDFYL